MAVEVESTSQAEEFFSVLKKRFWWIAIPAVIFTTLGVAFAIIVPKKYVSSTRVMVRDTKTGYQRGADSIAEGKVAAHMITSPNRIRAVLAELRWPDWLNMTSVEQSDFVDRLHENIEVQTPVMPRETNQQLVNVSFANPDPDRAAEFLGALLEKWKSQVLQRGENSAQKDYEQTKESRGDLENRREDISDEITALHREFDVPLAEPDPRTGDLPVGSQWEEASVKRAELATLERGIRAKRVRIDEEDIAVAKMDEEIPITETLAGQAYEKEISALRTKNLELQQVLETKGYKPDHSKYTQIQNLIEANEVAIETLEASQANPVIAETLIPNPKRLERVVLIDGLRRDLERDEQRELALVAELADLQAEMRELYGVYTQIQALNDERERVNNALKELTLKEEEAESELTFQRGPGGNPFEVLDEVDVPTRPTEPDPILITLFAVFAGLAIGLALAVVTEYSKNCFRSVNDITRVMIVPVLGTVNSIVTRRQQARRLAARALLTGGMLLFVGTFAAVTWTWSSHRERLPDGLRDSIEALRDQFK